MLGPQPFQPPDSLRVRLLGSMSIDDIELARLGSRKARVLFARLALGRGRPVSTRELVEAIWPDGNPPGRPSEQISVLVSRVRAVIGADRLPRVGGGYAVRLDWLDVDAVAELAAEARRRLASGSLTPARTAADAALALDRGALLDDEPDAPWLDAQRSATERTRVEARQVAAEVALAVADPWAAVEHAEQVLAAEPYHEAALRVLMTALAQSDRPARALSAYAEFADRLRDELGVDTQPATAALHVALLRGETFTPAPLVAPGRLPGRDLQLAMLAAAYTDAAAGRAVRVLVQGEAGIGKTRLLEAFAGALPEAAILLRATGSELGRRLPLQPLLDALTEHLRRVGPDSTATVLNGPSELLAAFLGPLSAGAVPHDGAGTLAAAGDPGTGLALLLAALDTALERLAGGRPVVILIDDAHWVDSTTLTWLGRVATRLHHLPLLVVLASRGEERVALPADRTVKLGPLDLAAVTAIVGADRAVDLLARSGGHPLFLVELGEAAAGALPESIRASVAERCDRAGPAGATLRAAAVLGSTVDLDLLGAVLGEPPAVLLDHLEEGVRRHLLVERETGFAFRHQLIQDALRADIGVGRRCLLHRQAARSLAARGDRADPLLVAHFALGGGDRALAAQALATAGEAAAARFDHDEALRHLTAAIELDDSPELRVRRARAALPAGHFAQAAADAEQALGAGPTADALEAAGIAAYLLRDLSRCRRLAEKGARLATDTEVRSSCYALAGRSAHVTGDLSGAQALLTQAREVDAPSTRALVGIWSAPVLVDQGHPDRALEALADPTVVRRERHPFMLPHRHLAAAAAHAALGDVTAALTELDAVNASAAGQGTPRFSARANNTRAFILRNTGATEAADACNTAAYEISLDQLGMGEPIADAMHGLADGRLRAHDLDGAAELLAREEHEAPSPRPFAWRHALRRRLLAGRLALARGENDQALAAAHDVLAAATALPLPRYVVLARLLAAAANPTTFADIEDDVSELEWVAPLEAWWLTDDLTRRFDSPRLRELASRRATAQREREALVASMLTEAHPSGPAPGPAAPVPPTRARSVPAP
ncbi:MAG TPA: AAA family ATPase [Micromonosporaceae bacterium]|jgi:DNA-binding SARP family transcriptional activator/tetratricopeptide (TPR) repeat protein